MKASYFRYELDFKRPSGTSRGVLTKKETWFLIIERNGKRGIGECGLLRGLSADDRPDYEDKLRWVCENIHLGAMALWERLLDYPSIQFGVETAFLSLESPDPFILFPSDFTSGTAFIPINGLVWMGDREFMLSQVEEKIQAGFTCIKLKIGALDFEKELEILRYVREKYHARQIEIRLDANGAFSSKNALDRLTKISGFQVHSVEQPVKKNQPDTMSALANSGILPIALDEELIGVFAITEKEKILDNIRPQYIVLKPSLVGGIRGTQEWIRLAESRGIGWWITSALESNIGLNAIAQFTYLQGVDIPQGLGTGALYLNNFESPLTVQDGFLKYVPEKQWNFTL